MHPNDRLMESIDNRLKNFRKAMQECGIDAMIVPTADPHLSEYVADHWKYREWLSGFTGSAGTLVITQNEARLWTDSRYYIQAEEQLKGSEIILFKESEAQTPSMTDWISSKLSNRQILGLDGQFFPVSKVIELENKLYESGIFIKENIKIKDLCGDTMPPLPHSPIFKLETKFAGEESKDKLTRIREVMKKNDAKILLLSALDEIAWTLNIRASDVEHTPVAICFALIYMDKVCLFTNSTMESKEREFDVLPYDYIYKVLETLPYGTIVMIDESKTNFSLYETIRKNAIVFDMPSPVAKMKAIKNKTELDGIRKAMVKDGVALCRSFFRIEEKVLSGDEITEIDVSNILLEERQKEENFFRESFSTIAGYAEHGAIVHYNATQESNVKIGTDNLLLVDSGANYFDGTTDITRTFCFGTPTEEQRCDYTDVLKGHIAIATAKFPLGTCGYQLDAIAKQFLWQRGLTYGHGTGHGIGHFLCVHEGPQNISPRINETSLKPGMILSDEPGIYKKGKHGIRIENVVCVNECNSLSSEMGDFLQFETMTLFPYDLKLVKKEKLTSEETKWINNYHRNVYAQLSPYLDEKTKEWLKLKIYEI